MGMKKGQWDVFRYQKRKIPEMTSKTILELKMKMMDNKNVLEFT